MKSFEVKLKLKAEEVVAKAKAASKSNGVTMEGDHSKGHFNGQGVEGNYHIEGSTLTIRITKKPLIVPWSLLETKIKNFFG